MRWWGQDRVAAVTVAMLADKHDRRDMSMIGASWAQASGFSRGVSPSRLFGGRSPALRVVGVCPSMYCLMIDRGAPRQETAK